jgi:CubicO group peptidase (beta-lactamase class C family)/outer membrane lipoprotein-sorting protein
MLNRWNWSSEIMNTNFKPYARLRTLAAYALVLSLAVHSIAPCTHAAQGPSDNEEPSSQQRLERLCQQLDAQRESMHVPGVALAVVKDDQVILSRGFGLRDVDRNLPVTDETLFAIGSATKAFTATLIGMLVDEGTMTWDDPVRKHLPDFHLKEPAADDRVTIRDLLCHRTGLAHMDLLWGAGTVGRREILRTVRNAELFSPFREKFNYNNVMFLAAGEAAAQAAHSDWDSLVRDRLLVPLGMSRSNTTYESAQQYPELATGYVWDEDESTYKVKRMRNLANIAPAGAINSCAKDMAHWLRFQLAKGTIGETRLISQQRIDDTWTKQIDVAPNVGYGLGWMVRDWNGRRLIEHGGNIDGFASQVALLPDEKLGFALLANVSATPLQALSMNIVFDSLLGQWSDAAQVIDLAEIQKYLGKYRFDALNTDVTVLVQNGRLAVDVPNQMVFELKPPDEAGKWYFDFPEPIAVSFEEDDKGEVNIMKLYQRGLTFELPRQGYVPPREVESDAVQKYLGTYHFEPRNEDWTVKIHNGRLAVDVPRQMIMELRGPDEQGVWACRVSDRMTVRFIADDTGAIRELVFVQGDTEYKLPRTGNGSANALPTVDEVIALQSRGFGSENLSAIQTIQMTGDIHVLNAGIQGTINIIARGASQSLQRVDLGNFGVIQIAVDGNSGWINTSFSDFEMLKSDQLNNAKLQHPLTLARPWRELFQQIEVTGTDTFESRKVYVVELAAAGDLRCTVWLDAESGLVHKELFHTSVPGLGRFVTTLTYGDYRAVGGVQLPHRFEIDNEANGKMVARVTNVQTNVPLTDHAFKPPRSLRQ